MAPGQAKQIRQALGLTWKGLAERLGVHWRTVAKWERGERAITTRTAKQLQGLLQS